MPPEIYLDHAAGAPMHPRVIEAVLPWVQERYGNPSARYERGRNASAAIESARAEVAEALGSRTSEVIFTSGGSESVNAAIKGIAHAQQLAGFGSHLVVSEIEHDVVLRTCQYLEAFGFQTTHVGVDSGGQVSPEALAAAVRPDTVLVSIMHANNEVGTVAPIRALAEAVRARSAAFDRVIPFHTDAVQSPLWLSVDVDELGVDALSLSAHKFSGPTGSGVLYLRRGVPFLAQQSGGGQERQRRAGTEHVPGIVGTGVALRLAAEGRKGRCIAAAALRCRLAAGIRERVPGAIEHASAVRRLPSILSFSFPGARGDRLVESLDRAGIATSSGSACASQSWEPSHVLLAMGLPLELAAAGVRFSLGPDTSEAEVDEAIKRIPEAVATASPAEVI